MRLYTRSSAADAPLYVRFKVRKQSYEWCTKTHDPKLAAERAEEYRQRIISGKLDMAAVMKSNHAMPTLQEIIDAYQLLAVDVKEKSKQTAVYAFKTLCESAGLGLHRTVDCLTDHAWQTMRRRRTAGLDGDALAAAKRTCNSIMRCAHSLFTRPMMMEYRRRWTMPDLSSFLSMQHFRCPHPKFKAIPEDVQAKALEAAKAKPMWENAFRLALFAGLRAGEIATARWDWIQNGAIVIPCTIAKSKDSRAIPLAPETIASLHKLDPVQIVPGLGPRQMRGLMKALRRAGIFDRKPLHHLRKQFGANVATTYGLFAAQKLLGHSSPDLTSRIYSDLVSLPAPNAIPAWAAADHKTPPAVQLDSPSEERGAYGTSYSVSVGHPESQCFLTAS